MSRPIRKRFAPRLKAGALTALVALFVPAAAQADAAGEQRAGGKPADRWSRTLALDLSARELGLPASASAQRLARAALERKAARLGLRGSPDRLRLDRRLRKPAIDGARGLSQLRFQQTAGSLRVVWSQIDVTIVAGKVSSIVATVVPTEGGPVAGEPRVSRERALGIARRAVSGAEQALRPLPAAYAGSPSAARGAEPRRARRVWVVEVQPASALGDETPTGLCIVVDAQSGKVIGRWPGMADRPDRGRNARGVDAGLRSAVAALRDPRDNPSAVLQVFDGTGGALPEPFTEAPRYASFETSGSPRVNANWPSYQAARDSGVTPTAAMEAISANAANVARTICNVRGYCGRLGGFQPGASSVVPWNVIGNTAFRGLSSGTSAVSFHVWIRDKDVMQGSGDPNVPANDVVAHEFGHVMDWVYAGDRFVGGRTHEGDEVEEALADMFAYEYDRFDATFGEDRDATLDEDGDPVARNWADPEAKGNPAHMDDYDDTPFPNQPDQHFNSTILSHAYYLFVQRAGHHRAGRVLHNVPAYLSPRPTFQEVVNGFVYLSRQIYPQDGPDPGTSSDVADAATAGFAQVGLQSHDHRGE